MQTVHNPYLEFIRCQFDEIDQTIQTRNKRGYFDTPKKCEDLFCQLLNITFDWQLINLNRAKHNVPAIDLGDLEHKVCVQVTSCRDKCKKLKQTIMAFDKHHLQTQYNKLLREPQL